MSINFSIKDYRDYCHEPHKKKPYFLTVNSNGERFYFSNKKKAERWLSKFSKESTELYKELGSYLSSLYELNISCVDIISFVNFQKKRNDIDYYCERYWRVLRGYTSGIAVEIGTELYKLFNFIQSQQEFYRKLLRSHNRYNLKYHSIRVQIKQLKRLKTDFDLLLTDVDGMKKVTKTDVDIIHSELILDIA
ncbi:hypothetical protein P8625_02890 [Tenacibaculum tangerinum]|uniref:Uncharacterized protein n=1 Tax=Tenacibaculum tangerinum TaxID=3038772 RepID=A0ABY8L838_9FLAO|nr:hypothetical protein [Tenacibaculum tangerinum]WGH76130.1 hypothetical protein P8625_02890 [Tenacibaculum tangerinum]